MAASKNIPLFFIPGFPKSTTSGTINNKAPIMPRPNVKNHMRVVFSAAQPFPAFLASIKLKLCGLPPILYWYCLPFSFHFFSLLYF